MKRLISIGFTILVVCGIMAIAFIRSAEFRTENTSKAEDTAWFLLMLFVLAFIALAIDVCGDSFLTVWKTKSQMKLLDAEHAAESAEIDAAKQEIAARQELPEIWDARARELAAIYDGEYKAELARQGGPASHPTFLRAVPDEPRNEHEH